MKNLLFLIDGLNPGGKERQLLEFIKELSKRGKYKIGLITFNTNQHYSKMIESKVDFYKELKKKPNPISPFFSIWKPIKSFQPQIIHTWDSLASLYGYLPSKLLGIKFIDGSIRDAGVDKGWHRKLKLFFLKRADLVISNSIAGLRAYHIRGRVIYNAIDLNRFHKPKKKDDFSIIMVANFTEYKDHQTFITAALQLVKSKMVDRVFLLGDGPYKQKYIDMIKMEEVKIASSFIFPGAIYEVEEYLNQCKVGVLCSNLEFGEGVSNSVLEYMASGLIPIVTDIGGSSEIISNNVNGILIEPGSSDEIIIIISEIKKNESDYDSVLKNAKETIQNKFSIHANVDELEEIYHDLILHD